MQQEIKLYRDYIINKEHHHLRKDSGIDFSKQFSEQGLSPMRRMTA